ncbi:MAG: hypothetical protein ABIE22_02805 [archaeon]
MKFPAFIGAGRGAETQRKAFRKHILSVLYNQMEIDPKRHCSAHQIAEFINEIPLVERPYGSCDAYDVSARIQLHVQKGLVREVRYGYEGHRTIYAANPDRKKDIEAIVGTEDPQ